MSDTDIQRASNRTIERERDGEQGRRDRGQQGKRVAVLAQAAVPMLWLLRPLENLAPSRRPGCLIHRAMAAASHQARKKIRVGSDFSGMEAGVTALKRMGVPCTLAFSSDNDPSCQKFIREVHKPEVLFEDITTRRPEEECDVDLYLWAPPCQPFSCAGKLCGVSGHGKLMASSIKYIRRKRPRVSVMDNVKNLASKRFCGVLRGDNAGFGRLGV